jgi:type IV pilus assembly protein PilQ
MWWWMSGPTALIVKDMPDKIVEVRDLVTKLDVPTQQVMIDSRVVIAIR